MVSKYMAMSCCVWRMNTPDTQHFSAMSWSKIVDIFTSNNLHTEPRVDLNVKPVQAEP